MPNHKGSLLTVIEPGYDAWVDSIRENGDAAILKSLKPPLQAVAYIDGLSVTTWSALPCLSAPEIVSVDSGARLVEIKVNHKDAAKGSERCDGEYTPMTYDFVIEGDSLAEYVVSVSGYRVLPGVIGVVE